MAFSVVALRGQVPQIPNASEFTGTLEVTVKEHGSFSSFGITEEYTFDLSIKGQLKLDELRAGPVWSGKYDATVAFSAAFTTTFPQATCTLAQSYNGPLAAAGFGNVFELEVSNNTYILSPRSPLFFSDAKFTGTCQSPAERGQIVWWPFRHGGTPWLQGSTFQFTLPPAGQNYKGQSDVKIPGPGFGVIPTAPVTFYTYTVKWDLKPDEIEVVIDPEGYDQWRPEAGSNEDTIGNTINVKVKLQKTDGSTPKAEATKFKFELIETSKEPGIAMNYPLAAKAQKTHDLQISPLNNNTQRLDIKDFEGQNAETRGPPLREYTFTISSFDWGGWSKLKVTAVVTGLPPIVGYLKGDKSMKEVRLPKRAANSMIAEAWMKGQGGNKPDDDDSEKDPFGQSGCDGDGLTLYQEYRGFIENGTHIEGNTQKKDFFILNLIGADAEAGLWLFTVISGLEVHKDLTEAEFSPQDRLINGNFDKGPRRKDQHGVFMITDEAVDGAVTNFTQSGVAGRPGTTTGVRIQPRDLSGKSLSSPYNLRSIDQTLSYDVAIAHELLHSIGVDHHGPQDKSEEFELVHVDDPANTQGRPYFLLKGSQVELIDEKTGQDRAALFDQTYEAIKQTFAGDPQAWAFIQPLMKNYPFKIGEKGYEHSGDDSCVMRYFFASIYLADGMPNRYYWVPPGTEPLGFSICDVAKGTGVNGPRTPQPRYGDANLGKCRSQMCPNDAVPPVKR